MTSKQPIDASDLANDGAKASRLDVDQSINKPSAPPAAEIAPFSWLCFVIVASASFLSFLEYGVVMPSMEPYIRSIDNSSTASVMYSLSMSAFSFGRLCSLPFFGWWCDRNIMFHVLFASLLVDGCGNLLYGFAGAANSPYMILFGRLVSGLAAGNGALSMVYVALTTTPARRTGLMTLAAGSTSLAVALGPCLTLIINKMPFNVTGKVRFDSLTGPGFFVFVLDVAMAGVVALFFTSPSIEVVRARAATARNITMTRMELIKDSFSKGAGSFFVMAFTGYFIFGALDTMITPYTQNYMGWNNMDDSYLFGGIAVCALSVTLTSKALAARGVSDRTFLLVGQVALVSLFLSACILLPNHTVRHWGAVLIIAFAIVSLPFQMGALNSAFTKVIPVSMVSRLMSFITAIGTIGRVAGPLWGGNASYEHAISWLGLFIAASIGAFSFGYDFNRIGVVKPAPAAGVQAELAKPLLAADGGDESD